MIFIDNNDPQILSECYEYLKNQEVIALDIETSRKYPKGIYAETIYKPGLDPRLSRIVMVQVGTLERQYIIDARKTDCSFLKPILEDHLILKVGANLVFESLFFLEHFNCVINNLYDVLLVDRILTNGLYDSYSLESLLKRYRNYKAGSIQTLFGEENSDQKIKELWERKVDLWVLLHGHISEDTESELYEEATEEILGNFIDKGIRTQFVEIGDKSFTEDQILYGELDILEPLKLREIFLQGRKVGEEIYYPTNAIKMENKLITVLAKMIYDGVCLDQNEWLKVYEEKKKDLIRIEKFLDSYTVNNHPEFAGMLDMFTNEPQCLISWQSSQQVLKLFKKLGLSVKARSKSTGKIADTVGAKELVRALKNESKVQFQEGNFPVKIEKNEDLVVAYLLFKQGQQLTTTYGKDFLQYIHPITGRIHCKIRQYLNTTRMAATSPNALAIPRGVEYRKCFVAPPGYKVWACDYSTQEIAVMGEVFKNETIQSFFVEKLTNPKADVHSWTASQVYKIVYNDPNFVCDKNVHKKERQNAKVLSFGIPYGMGGPALAGVLGITPEEADLFISNYFKSLPGLQESFDKARKHAMKTGWIQICEYTDKRYFFRDFDKMNKLQEQAMSYYPDDYRTYTPEQRASFKGELYENYPEVKQLWRDYMGLKGTLERRAVNYKIQSASASQTKASLIYMYNHLRDTGEDWNVVLSIHD